MHGWTTWLQITFATVKKSLLFQFLNGASSYAPMYTNLLYNYAGLGSFYQGMEHYLYSTPVGKTSTNFSTDSKRQINHLSAIKVLRAG